LDDFIEKILLGDLAGNKTIYKIDGNEKYVVNFKKLIKFAFWEKYKG